MEMLANFTIKNILQRGGFSFSLLNLPLLIELTCEAYLSFNVAASPITRLAWHVQTSASLCRYARIVGYRFCPR